MCTPAACNLAVEDAVQGKKEKEREQSAGVSEGPQIDFAVCIELVEVYVSHNVSHNVCMYV